MMERPLDMREPPECPRCGSTYLHQEKVIVYARSREDSSIVDRVAVDQYNGEVEVSQEPAEYSPSPRRHGLRVQFMCEECSSEHGPVYWAMWQHKGQTFCEWEGIK